MLAWAMAALAAFFGASAARAQQSFDADVIVLDDTSGSMRFNDPQNAIVLVTRLFTDISPGKLAAVRLFDIGRDQGVVHATTTGQSTPCPDDPSRTCQVMNMDPDARDKVVGRHLLISNRNGRGDAAFKTSLEGLLKPTAMDTQYEFALATIEQQFKENQSPPETQKFVVWLSDGAPDAGDWESDKPYLDRLRSEGVSIRALVFKSGKPERVEAAGIKVNSVDGTPSGMMRAFADVFRQVVGAPYAVDGVAASQPTFKIMPRMEDAWVVFYGDESLSSASVTNGSQSVAADYAADHYNGAAYRVAYLRDPAAGNWTVHVDGGGAGASYAVIQRSSLTLYLYPVQGQVPGVPFKVVASLRNGKNATDLLPAELPEPVTLEANIDGQTVKLNDDGDGKYSGMLTANQTGTLPLTVRAHNSFLDRTATVQVNVIGRFEYGGGPLLVDFGQLKAGETVCRTLSFNADQQGAIPFELRQLAALPKNLTLELRINGKRSQTGGQPIMALPQDQKEVCLVSGKWAEASESRAQSWVNLAVNSRQDAGSVVELRMNWTVRPLSFWERWGWLILIILAVLLTWFVIYGYIKPFRFPVALALCYAPEVDELDDQTPQPIRLWRGVGIGFYRNARACLRDDFRINGQVKGAVAILEAGPRRSVLVKSGSRALYREMGVGEWEPVSPKGRRAVQGELYRVGESGPYFRITIRMMA